MQNGRIAVPTTDDRGLEGIRSGHFGHCQFFTLVDVRDGEIVSVTPLPNQEHTQGGCMVPVNLLHNNGVNAIIASGMGMRPMMGFQQVGIDVYFDATRPEVKPVVEDLINGRLPKFSENQVCGGGSH